MDRVAYVLIIVGAMIVATAAWGRWGAVGAAIVVGSAVAVWQTRR